MLEVLKRDRFSAQLFLECLRYFKQSLNVSDNAPQFCLVKSVTIYLMVVTSEHLSYTCTYCWQPVKHCDYEQHISRICPELLMECVFECGEYIARKEMKQHCQYQCNNAKQILSQQEEYKFAVNCFARQESD